MWRRESTHYKGSFLKQCGNTKPALTGPGHISSTGAWTCLFHWGLDMSKLSFSQQTVLPCCDCAVPGTVCKTGACAQCCLWACLFYITLSFPWTCLFYTVQQSVLSLELSVIKQPVLSLDMPVLSSQCAAGHLSSTAASAAPMDMSILLQNLLSWGVWSTAACAACGCVCS
jgi:hypothetical protein